jgi:hypothetical protein
MTAPVSGQTVCATCGHGMVRRPLAFLCGPGMPGPTYGDPTCSNEECPDVLQDAADRRAAQAARDAAAIEDAIARGVIVREHPADEGP